MGWVRFHRRYAAWPGLAALALQIVLSFGHVHVGNVHVEPAWRSAIGAIDKSQPATLARSQHQSPTHDPGRSSGDTEDYCAICASIFLASTSLAAQAPLLPVPSGFERVTLTFGAQAGFDVSRPTFFRSRAPPFA
jgi:hypothetical protein